LFRGEAILWDETLVVIGRTRGKTCAKHSTKGLRPEKAGLSYKDDWNEL